MQILKGTLFFPAMMKNRSLAKTLKGTGYVGCGRDILTRRWMVSMGCGLNSEDLWQNAQLCGRLEASTDVLASLQKNNIQVNQVKNWICGLFFFFLLWDIWIQQQSKCYNKRLSILTRNSLRWINFFFFRQTLVYQLPSTEHFYTITRFHIVRQSGLFLLIFLIMKMVATTLAHSVFPSICSDLK